MALSNALTSRDRLDLLGRARGTPFLERTPSSTPDVTAYTLRNAEHRTGDDGRFAAHGT
jgi:hypothetical protein